MRKTRFIPPIVTFAAGAAAMIILTLKHYELQQKLIIVLAVLFGFFILSSMIQSILDKYTVVEQDPIADEGEVIEKPEENEQNDTTEG